MPEWKEPDNSREGRWQFDTAYFNGEQIGEEITRIIEPILKEKKAELERPVDVAIGNHEIGVVIRMIKKTWMGDYRVSVHVTIVNYQGSIRLEGHSYGGDKKAINEAREGIDAKINEFVPALVAFSKNKYPNQQLMGLGILDGMLEAKFTKPAKREYPWLDESAPATQRVETPDTEEGRGSVPPFPSFEGRVLEQDVTSGGEKSMRERVEEARRTVEEEIRTQEIGRPRTPVPRMRAPLIDRSSRQGADKNEELLADLRGELDLKSKSFLTRWWHKRKYVTTDRLERKIAELREENESIRKESYETADGFMNSVKKIKKDFLGSVKTEWNLSKILGLKKKLRTVERKITRKKNRRSSH